LFVSPIIRFSKKRESLIFLATKIKSEKDFEIVQIIEKLLQFAKMQMVFLKF